MHLLVSDQSGNSSRFILAQGQNRIGKSPECEIFIQDPYASREHAMLRVEESAVWLKDLKSTNGTWVGRQKLSRELSLRSGDSFVIGNLTLFLDKCADDITANAGRSPIQSTTVKNKEVGKSDRLAAVNELDVTKYKKQVHEKLLEYLDMHKRSVIHTMSPLELRREAEQGVREVLSREKFSVPADKQLDTLIEEIVAEAVGLGPLEPYLADESITEIMVNGPDNIYVERAGKLYGTEACFNSTSSLMSIIERIVAPLGRRIDEGSPMVDARLSDGSRVNAIIPPLSLTGPVLTIRKFARRRYQVDDLVKMGTLSEEMARFLEICVQNRLNIIVSGGTGSGKTTTLNVLSNFIPNDERIVTIEDAAELQLEQGHLISLESRPANIEGKGQIAIRDLVKNALRMRPDRIVVGECRGGEALDMLQAMNTGHDGSLTTGHANSARDFLSRLEVMVLMSGVELPVRAIREQVASAVDIIVQQTRFSDGKRRITSIVEVDGMEGDVILLQKIFEFKQSGRSADGAISGEFSGCGYAPRFYEALEATGQLMDRSLFGIDQSVNEPTPQWKS